MKIPALPEERSLSRASHSEAATTVATALWAVPQVLICLPVATAICISLRCASSFAQTPDSVAERAPHRRHAGITIGEPSLARGQAGRRANDHAAPLEAFSTTA